MADWNYPSTSGINWSLFNQQAGTYGGATRTGSADDMDWLQNTYDGRNAYQRYMQSGGGQQTPQSQAPQAAPQMPQQQTQQPQPAPQSAPQTSQTSDGVRNQIPQQSQQGPGNLDPQIYARLNSMGAGGSYTDPATGMTYSDNASGMQGLDGGNAYNPATEYYAYKGGTQGKGDPYATYGADGKYSRQGQFLANPSNADFLKSTAEIAALVYSGGTLAGAWAPEAAASAVFNPAVDSQLANAAIGPGAIDAYTAGTVAATGTAAGTTAATTGATTAATTAATTGATTGATTAATGAATGTALSQIGKAAVPALVTAGVQAITGKNGGKGSGGGGGGGGGSGSGDIYTPNARPQMDQNFQNNYNEFARSNSDRYNATNQRNADTFNNTYNDVNQPAFMSAALRAGQTYGDQSQRALGASGNMYDAGNRAYDMGFDPRQAYYNKQRQDLMDSTRAAQYARGVSMTPYGAGVEANTMENFGMDWQNQQQSRAGIGIQQMGQAYKSGSALGNTGAAMQLASGQTGYDASNTIHANQNAAIGNYWKNNEPYMANLNQLQSNSLGYMNHANSAANMGFNQNMQSQQANDRAIGQIAGPISQGINNIWGNQQPQANSTAYSYGGYNYDNNGNPTGGYGQNNPSYDPYQPYMPDTNNYTPNYN